MPPPPQQQQQQQPPPHQEYPGAGFAGQTHQVPMPEPTGMSNNQHHSQFFPQQDTPQQQNQDNTSFNYNNDFNEDDVQFGSPQGAHSKLFRAINLRYQHFLDVITPHKSARWAFSLFTLFVFMLRIVMAQGWYVICYGLSIYYLNLFIAFLSPKIDPAFASSDNYYFDSTDSGPMLPTKANDEFKPFIRRLPEFKFWLSGTTATLISLLLTLFEVFDLPVFWPILLLYFILLFISTMRQQIRHMIKYGYVPWDKGKKRYGGQNDNI